jgi:hypothetical protein
VDRVVTGDELAAALDADRAAHEGHGGAGGTGGGHDGQMAAYVLQLGYAGLDRDERYLLWRAKADAEQDESWPFGEADFERHDSNTDSIVAAAHARYDPPAGLTGTLAYAPSAAGDQSPLENRSPDGQVPPSLLARVKNGTWLSDQVFAPLHYHVDGLVPEGLTVLTGAPKIGKSWLVLAWLLDLARKGCAVLYLALEDSDRRMQWRCRSLLGAEPVPEALRYMTEEDVVPGMLLPTVAQFTAEHHDRAPLVVLDTLAKAMQQTPRVRDEPAYERDYRVTSALQAAVKGCPGAGLLICHHDRKAGGEDWMDRVSGTKGVTGGPDAVIFLERKRNAPAGALHVTGRDIAEEDYAMMFDGARWTFDGGTLHMAAGAYIARKAQAGLGDRSADIVAYAAERGDAGARMADVAAKLGITPDEAAVYLTRLYGSGRLARPKRGLYKSVGCVSSGPPDLPNQHNQHFPIPPAREAGNPVDDSPAALAGCVQPDGVSAAQWEILHRLMRQQGKCTCGPPGG